MTAYNPYWNDPCPNCGGPHHWQTCQNVICNECGSQGGHWSSCSSYNPYLNDPCPNCGGPHHWRTCQNVKCNECGSQGGHWSSCSYCPNPSYDSWDADDYGETSSTFQSQEEEVRMEQMMVQAMKNSNEISLAISKMDSQIRLLQEQIVREEISWHQEPPNEEELKISCFESELGGICTHEDDEKSDEENGALESCENLTNVIWDDDVVSRNGDVKNIEPFELERIKPHSIHFLTLNLEGESDFELTKIKKEVLGESENSYIFEFKNDEVDVHDDAIVIKIEDMTFEEEIGAYVDEFCLDEDHSPTKYEDEMIASILNMDVDDEMSVLNCTHVLEELWVPLPSLNDLEKNISIGDCIFPYDPGICSKEVFVKMCYGPLTKMRENKQGFFSLWKQNGAPHFNAKKIKMKQSRYWSMNFVAPPNKYERLHNSKLGRRFTFTKWREKPWKY